jgi:hypothetical protein
MMISFSSIEKANGVVLAVLLVILTAGYFGGFFDPLASAAPGLTLPFFPSLVIGSVLMALNMSILGRMLRRLLGGVPQQKWIQGVILTLLMFKTAVFALAVFLLFHYLAVAPLGLVSGAMLILMVPVVLLVKAMLVNIKPLKME